MKNFIATSITSIISISTCLLAFSIYLLLNSFLAEKEKLVVTIDPSGWCGVIGLPFSTKEEKGKTLFKNNCASCHNKDMKSKLTGPALGGVTVRWSTFPEEDLYHWIRNSQELIAKGHPRAKILWAEWNLTVMTSFPNLTLMKK